MSVSLPDVATVIAMAPDASAARAGQGLASARQWTSLGRNDEALWGLCQGSGKHPYQTRVALAGMSTACTCPSRKFPCKHALGLLLLAAQDQVPLSATVPAFAAEWLAARRERVEKKERAASVEKTPEELVKAKAQSEKRAEQRDTRMADGLADLQRWLDDLVRAGLGNAPVTDAGFWTTRARRLVDAQLSGLGTRIARCYTHALGGAQWPKAVLRELALVTLALEAHARRDALDDTARSDLARVLGVPQEKSLAEERIDDDWLCLGAIEDGTEQLNVQRAWFVGAATSRYAHVVAVGPAHVPLAPVSAPGRCERMALRFFPSALPIRAFIDERGAAAAARPGGSGSIDAALDGYAGALARDPWLDSWPLEVEARLARDADGAFWIVDRAGAALPVSPKDRATWTWLAITRGDVARLALEWNGEDATLLHGWPT